MTKGVSPSRKVVLRKTSPATTIMMMPNRYRLSTTRALLPGKMAAVMRP